MWFLYALATTVLNALSNAADSAIVRHHQKDPNVIMFVEYGIGLLFLLGLLPFLDFQAFWTLPLLLIGITIYIADYAYYRVINDIDISTINAAWGLHALYLSITGILIFKETWSTLDATGAALILFGVFLLSSWGKLGSLRKALPRFAGLALLYAPISVVRKFAANDGVGDLTTVLLPILSFSLITVLGTFVVPSARRDALRAIRRAELGFFALICTALLTNFLGTYFFVRAFSEGSFSLTSIVTVTQPFFVMLFAWIAAKTYPSVAPLEGFAKEGLQIKIISLLLVACGMAMLGI